MSSDLIKTEEPDSLQRLKLQAEIENLKKQLDQIRLKIHQFETLLRNNLSDEIIEIQELTILYKQKQQAKKEKRLIQKQKGKNYKAQAAIQKSASEAAINQPDVQDGHELKRLYKEAMWLVHPDKFTMQEGMEEQATLLTQQLIEIYHSKNLEHLKAFYAQLTGNQAKSTKPVLPQQNSIQMLEIEKKNLEISLEKALTEHLYQILQEYENPMDYIQELKAYFDDKIFKLRKRTRKS